MDIKSELTSSVLALYSGRSTTTKRVLETLVASGDADSRELATMLLATAGQEYSNDLYSYLGGVSVTPIAQPAPSEPVKVERKNYVRPNGSIYYARPWGKFEDVEVMKMARENQKYVLMLGSPGTGKTALAEAAFGDDAITVVFSGDTDVQGLVGSFIPNPDPTSSQEYVWVDGPLTRAVDEGKVFIADEIGLGNSKVLSTLYPLMDGRGELIITDNPSRGVVKAKEGFFVVGATNPNAPGVVLSPALLSRFTLRVTVSTDWDLAESLGAPRPAVLAARALDRHMEADRISWAPQFRELMDYRDVEKIWGSEFALSNLLRLVPDEDLGEVMPIIRNAMRSVNVGPAKI